MACLKKVSEPQGDKLDDTLLYWKMDEPDSLKRSKLPKNGKKRSKKSDIDINDNPNPQQITNFKLNGTDKALEELVKESLKYNEENRKDVRFGIKIGRTNRTIH